MLPERCDRGGREGGREYREREREIKTKNTYGKTKIKHKLERKAAQIFEENIAQSNEEGPRKR
jgi:hypothetical protein